MSSNNSPSPHPSAVRSPSPAFSDSSLAEQSQSISGLDEPFDPVADPSDSSPGSPSLQDERALQSDSARCLWDDCGQIFLHLPTLIDHIHNEHIGVNKSNYTCEWATCPRRGLQQASRFALISHLRAHTGEKPYTCPRPECDKSFTRSDAMAKHMRLQHNMSTPQPGRGGNRKRKREEPAEPPEAPASGPGFSSFKIDQSTHAYDVDEDFHFDENNTEFLLPPPATRTRSTSPGAVSTSSLDEHEDDLPQRLKDAMDPETGKIYGRTPDMCRYIIMKAKHRYLLQQHEQLLEELRVARFEERKARAGKERALDRVLGRTLGPQAEFLIAPIDFERARQNIIAADSIAGNVGGVDARVL